eukprot:Rhum_TRINITY_DN15139_c1_g1::Rhum_TRINITY_DN15139_c1_g1_i1::g.140064::m.140064
MAGQRPVQRTSLPKVDEDLTREDVNVVQYRAIRDRKKMTCKLGWTKCACYVGGSAGMHNQRFFVCKNAVLSDHWSTRRSTKCGVVAALASSLALVVYLRQETPKRVSQYDFAHSPKEST